MLNNNFKKGLVSICVPTYNRSNLIGELLDSILAQTYTNFEVIITDNSDNLKTKELIESKYQDERIKYFKNEKNLGMDGNTLKALSFVSGEYFTFTPDDDVWIDKYKLEKQVKILNESNLNCCFSNALHIFQNGLKHDNQFSSKYSKYSNECIQIPSTDLLLTIKPEHFLCILTALIRVSYLDLFIKSWEFGSEEMFMWYIGGKGEKICFCYDQTVAIRDGEHNWQINDEKGNLINYKKNTERRSKQVFDKYQYLINNHKNSLILFNHLTERKIATILIKLIGFSSIKYINKFNNLKLFDKLYLIVYLLISLIYRNKK